MRLARYAGRRLLLLLPVLVGVSILTFLLVRVLPGDPVRTVLPQSATEADVAAARERFGLDAPLPVQYLIYLRNVATGDLGTSFQSGQDVGVEMGERIGATIELIGYAMIIALLVATVIGVAAALRRGGLLDKGARLVGIAGNAIPEFVLGLILIIVFYGSLSWAPAPDGRVDGSTGLVPITGASTFDAVLGGNLPALGSALAHLALPVTTLALVVLAPLLNTVRSGAVSVMDSDAYICAVAHGLPRRTVIKRYLARPTLAGLPTLTALIFGNLIGGAVLVETMFSWQGLGQWALKGLVTRDYPVIQTFVLVTAVAYLLLFLIADVVQAWLDPRVKI
ncbi:ABC transporter permease [Sphaerimonospora mesophila]|uniref:ABC transporter permease n=1 Tax=Sphaerimonospora mesophila TaxID=37483 RepID=UPI0006E36E4C